MIKKLWDALYFASIIGIWPRYIEPRLLSTTTLSLPIPNLPSPLSGFKILQLSDLHIPPDRPDPFLNRILRKTRTLQPDIVVFTGDFLNYSTLDNPDALLQFLSAFEAPYGCYAILGNHDYKNYFTLTATGKFDLSIRPKDINPILKGIQRIIKKIKILETIHPDAHSIPVHQKLMEVLDASPFTLLQNQTKTISTEKGNLNITGLGEYTLGKADPKTAFREYDPDLPGIILTHNPDSFPLLLHYPGELILAGHTHGAQVNIPFLWNRITMMNHPKYKRGLFKTNDKWLYVNRGLGSAYPFRWFSFPEILSVTLRSL